MIPRKPPSKSHIAEQERRERKLQEAEQHRAAVLNSLRSHFRYRLEPQYSNRFDFDLKAHARKQAIGHAIAVIIARHKGDPWRMVKQDYQDLDRVCGHRVRRESQVTDHMRGRYLTHKVSSYLAYIIGSEAHGRVRDRRERDEPEERKNLGFAGCKPWYPPEPAPYNPIQECLLALLEVEYWREMVRLGQEQMGLCLEAV